MYDYVLIQKWLIFKKKSAKKLIEKSSDFSSLYRNIKSQRKYSLNPTIYKFNNKSIQSKQLIGDAFVKHFSSIYIPDLDFN
jgi:hypothetical protein